jgi:hypothetical protein
MYCISGEWNYPEINFLLVRAGDNSQQQLKKIFFWGKPEENCVEPQNGCQISRLTIELRKWSWPTEAMLQLQRKKKKMLQK